VRVEANRCSDDTARRTPEFVDDHEEVLDGHDDMGVLCEDVTWPETPVGGASTHTWECSPGAAGYPEL
jgi:hypothetical protein